jgi:hypothetical protein
MKRILTMGLMVLTVARACRGQAARPKFDVFEVATVKPVGPDDAPNPPLFTAVQEQLGLKLEAMRGMVAAMVVEGAVKPSVD